MRRHLPVAVTAPILGLGGFAATAGAARQQLLDDIDRSLVFAFRMASDRTEALGPAWFEEAVADISAFGSYPVVVSVVVAAIICLLVIRRWRMAAFLGATLASAAVISTAAKLIFSRARPDLVDHLDRTFTSSFPSAHAMISAVGYLAMAAVASQLAEDRRLGATVFGIAAVMTLLVGISRVYLGVHWPSDIVAGWCLGVAWVGICWLILHSASRRAGAHPGASSSAPE